MVCVSLNLFLHMNDSCSSIIFLKNLLFLYRIAFASLLKSTLFMWVYFWAFCCIPLIYVSILLTMLCCLLDCYSFTIRLKVCCFYCPSLSPFPPPTSSVLLRLLFWVLPFRIHFRISFSISTK